MYVHVLCMFLYFGISGDYNKELFKMVYLQNRRFLPMSSELRKQSQSFPYKHEEEREPPAHRTWAEAQQLHIAYDNASKG